MNIFQLKFKTFCEQLKTGDRPLKIDQRQINYGLRYKIHKRSLPVGLDQPIAWGLSETDAKSLIAKKLKSKIVKDSGMTYDVVYYDMVAEDGTRSSVYDNPPEIIKEDWID